MELEYNEQSFSSSEEQEFVKTKKKVSRLVKKKKNTQKEDEGDRQNPEVVSLTTSKGNISHQRPAFLKRWDGESNYLEIYEEEYRAFPPSMAVYWRQKSQYMRAVIFVQFGYMEYHVYENDALLFHELFGKNLGRYSKYLIARFFPTQLTQYTHKLFKLGIAMRFLQEVDDYEYKKKHKIIKRVVKKVINPGVHLDYQCEVKQPSQRFLLSIYPSKQKNQLGVAVIDTNTNICYIQQSYLQDLRRILNKFKPVQIVIPFGQNKQIKGMIKQICSPYVIELTHVKTTINDILKWAINKNNSPIFENISKEWQQYQQSQQFQPKNFKLYHCMMAVDLLSQYFKKLQVWDQIIPTSKFQLSCFITLNIKPVFDSQVYQNLEIFEIKNQPDSFGEKGTLYAYLNKCRTKAGQRKLRQWINNPLTDVQNIKKRQGGIQQVLDYMEELIQIHNQFKLSFDLQTKTANVYHWLIKNPQNFQIDLERNKIYQQSKNPLLVKAKQIKLLLQNFEKSSVLLQKMNKNFCFKSPYLIQLINEYSTHSVTQQQQGDKKQKNLPKKIQKIVKQIFSNFTIDKNGDMHPKVGLVPQYDKQREQILKLNNQLDTLLQQYQKTLKLNKKMKYVSVRARNQIQILKQQQITKKDAKWFHLSSFTQKVTRYTTSDTVSITQQIIGHQRNMDLALVPFLNQLVKQFSKHKFVWNQLINIYSQLDVMLALAEVSNQMQIKCMPEFIEFGLEYTDGLHIGLSQTTKNVVRNSIKFQNKESAMLITGPNMGGKSTFLRQTCILAIIAQIGCFVPAASYKSHPFDQIFCRIGASDRLHQGKSTFYVEMQQTKHILEKATKNSLVIIDQLGRGTSTFDGVSIAVGVLRDLTQNIGCITLFSTHHSIIADQFELCQNIRNKTVDYTIKQGNLIFKYQLKDGVVQKSFALNVAGLVGIPDQILKRAYEKSQMITKQSHSLRLMQIITKKFNDLLFSIKKQQKTKTEQKHKE